MMLSQGALATIRKNALEEIRVELSEFNGHDLLNIRIWTDPRNGGSERRRRALPAASRFFPRSSRRCNRPRRKPALGGCCERGDHHHAPHA